MQMSHTESPSRPLRVAFVDYVLEPDKPGRSGLSDFVWDMASEIVNRGHEVHVVASYGTVNYPDPRVIVHNFKAPPMGYRNIVGNLLLLCRAASILRMLKPDLIHAPEYISTAVLSVLRIEPPLVLTVPGNIYHRIEYGHSYEWHIVQVLKIAARISAKKCTVIAVSKEMKDWWEWTGSRPEKTFLIPTGIDTSRFAFVDQARSKLDIPIEAVVLLYAGRLASEKGLTDLLQAVDSLRKHIDIERLQLYLVGNGPLKEKITKQIVSLDLVGNVMLRDWVPKSELRVWYSAADAFVLPSHTEAFSRTIGEAMACGTPIIGTNITGTSDHVRDGFNGYLFGPGDQEALTAILRRLLHDTQHFRSLRGNCLEYVHSNLTWSRVMDNVIQTAYSSALGKNRDDRNLTE